MHVYNVSMENVNWDEKSYICIEWEKDHDYIKSCEECAF